MPRPEHITDEERVVVAARLTSEQRDQLKNICRLEKRSMGAQVSILIEDFLNNYSTSKDE